MASSTSSSSLPPRAPGGGGGGAAAAAFQSLEGKIESMQREHKEKLRALESKKREAQAMQEDLLAFRQAKHLLERKAAVLNMQLQQGTVKLLDSQVQTEAVTHATQELQRLLTLYQQQQQQQQPIPNSSNTTTVQGNDDEDAAATAATTASTAPAAASGGVLTTLLEEGRKWEAKALESEVQLRLLRRLNLLMEDKTQELQRKLEEKQEEKSRLVRQNLRSEESARLVSVHEAMVAQKRALQQQRGIKMRVWQQVESKKARLEGLKKKAQAMDASLRAEEASYMNMQSAATAATTAASLADDAAAAAAAAAAEAAAVVIPSTPAQEEETGRGGRRLERQEEEGKEEAEKGKRQKTGHQQEEGREGYDLSLACDA